MTQALEELLLTLQPKPWLLYAVDSPNASQTRGLNRSSFFDRMGNIVAPVTQASLIRYQGET